MKKTLFFGSPAYLRLHRMQLEVEMPKANAEKKSSLTTIPIEDIGIVVLEHPQITISLNALSQLMESGAVIITCDSKHMPNGILFPMDGHTLQSKRYRDQIEASLPLKKQLWAQTVKQKIQNQARALMKQGVDVMPLLRWSTEVKSGDVENHEARAAAWYWPRLFKNFESIQTASDDDTLPFEYDDFVRDRYGDWPNALLNYGYAVLRAVVARALVGSGLLPALGIHHRNQYNAYCLADDIMEPFRPSVDVLVCEILRDYPPKCIFRKL